MAQEIDWTSRSRSGWTLASGLFTLLLAVAAFLLPQIDWVPRGGLVGWTLFLAGAVELALGCARGLDPVGRTHVGSGLITGLAGLIFIAEPSADYFPVANVVMAWLILRGAWVLATGSAALPFRAGPWLIISGAADILLGVALFAGLQIAALVVLLFGPTEEAVAQFGLILATSFAITGAAQVATAISQRRPQ